MRRRRQNLSEGADLRGGPEERGGHHEQDSDLFGGSAEARPEQVADGGKAAVPEGGREEQAHEYDAERVAEGVEDIGEGVGHAGQGQQVCAEGGVGKEDQAQPITVKLAARLGDLGGAAADRKSTRLNFSHRT